MISSLLKTALVTLIIVAIVNICVASVPIIYLSDLVFYYSDLIVTGRVVSIFETGDIKVAKVSIDEVLKGDLELKNVFILAQPTHPSDISKAVMDERTLFFLNYHIFGNDRSTACGEKLYKLEDGTPVFTIAHYGHGRMPIYQKNGIEHVESRHSLVIPAIRGEKDSPLLKMNFPDGIDTTLESTLKFIYEIVERQNRFLYSEPEVLFEYLKEGTDLQKNLAEWALEQNALQIKIDLLIQRLQDDDPRVRSIAASLMAIGKDSKTVNPLINALSDYDDEVRKSAINALGQLRDSRALEPLVNILKDSSEKAGVRGSAANALAQLGDTKALEHLETVLEEDLPSCCLRDDLLESIFNLDYEHGLELLLSTARSDDASARQSAMFIAAIELGRMKADSAIKPLISMLDEEIGEVAAEALTKITGQDFGRDSTAWMEWWEKRTKDNNQKIK
jgi:HEAT repeat protein